MKKILLSALLLVACATSNAQNDTFKEDILKVISISGSVDQIKMIKKQLQDNIPADKLAMFNLEFDGLMAKFYDKIAEQYKLVYTHSDIQEMLKFYESPIGIKIQKATPVLLEKSQEAGSQLGQDLQPMLLKYMQ